RSRHLVLSLDARLAGQPGVHLRTLGHQSGCLVAMRVSPRRRRSTGGTLADAGPIARTLRRGAVFLRHAVSSAGFPECLSVLLLDRGRSLPVFSQPGMIALASAGVALLADRWLWLRAL